MGQPAGPAWTSMAELGVDLTSRSLTAKGADRRQINRPKALPERHLAEQAARSPEILGGNPGQVSF